MVFSVLLVSFLWFRLFGFFSVFKAPAAEPVLFHTAADNTAVMAETYTCAPRPPPRHESRLLHRCGPPLWGKDTFRFYSRGLSSAGNSGFVKAEPGELCGVETSVCMACFEDATKPSEMMSEAVMCVRQSGVRQQPPGSSSCSGTNAAPWELKHWPLSQRADSAVRLLKADDDLHVWRGYSAAALCPGRCTTAHQHQRNPSESSKAAWGVKAAFPSGRTCAAAASTNHHVKIKVYAPKLCRPGSFGFLRHSGSHRHIQISREDLTLSVGGLSLNPLRTPAGLSTHLDVGCQTHRPSELRHHSLCRAFTVF